MRQDSSITEIKGIGEKTKKLFEKMGVFTVGDILLHFPKNYIQYPHPVPIDEMTAEHMQTEDKLAIVARIERTPVTRSGRHMQVTLLVIGSPGHQIQLIWYRMPYIRNTLTHGKYFVFYGNVHIKDGKFVMDEKDYRLVFKGSKNQRIIDVQASLEKGSVILSSYDDKNQNID